MLARRISKSAFRCFCTFKPTGAQKEAFIDSKLFENEDKIYEIYSNPQSNKLQLISLATLFATGFYIYDYVYGEELLDKASSLLLSSLGVATSFWLFYSSKRTLKSLSLLSDGRTLLLSNFKYFGFFEELTTVGGIKGIQHFGSQRMKMPMIVFNEELGNRKRRLFFKGENVKDKDAFRMVCAGWKFKVLPKSMHLNVSRKYKK